MTPLERPVEFANQNHFTKEQAREFELGYDRAFRQSLQESDGDGFVGTDLWLDFGSGVSPDLRTSLVIDPTNGLLPAKTKAAKDSETSTWQKRKTFNGPEVLDVSERCISDIVPILSGQDNNYLSIAQTDDSILISLEFLNGVRIVRLKDAIPPPESIRFWLGYSVGTWEGSDLVVQTTNFRMDSSLFGAGSNAHLSERFHFENPDLIRYDFTISDQDTFTRSWTARSYFTRTSKKRYEFACHEGNYRTMKGILLGSRILEQEAHHESP